MLRRALFKVNRLIKNIRMEAARLTDAETQPASVTVGEKRQNSDSDSESKDSKKTKFEPNPPMQGRVDRKRKVALLLAYCGEGYYGIQRNIGFPTIEEELIKALRETDLIPQEHADNMQKMSFQRAARTDKGVSAAGQVVSLKMLLNRDNLVDDINAHLPEKIRVIGYRRATRGFNSKNHCTSRTYIYVTPTYAFAPFEKFVTEEYRTNDEILQRVNEVLACFKGTHNFHNFTSGIKPDDRSAFRYIIDFECGPPFVRDGIEFVVLTVRGQSFMLHHIRKMVGITIAILRGYCGTDTIEKAWKSEKVDIPKAPSTGLFLDKLQFDGYNKRYGQDGMHEPIVWEDFKEQTDKFKDEYIYPYIVKAEKQEKVMLRWLATLHFHSFDVREVHGNGKHFIMRKKLEKMDEAGAGVKQQDSDSGDESSGVVTKEMDVEANVTTESEKDKIDETLTQKSDHVTETGITSKSLDASTEGKSDSGKSVDDADQKQTPSS